MSAEVDVLFFSYYGDLDRWHNDFDSGVEAPPARAPHGAMDQTIMGRIERQSVKLDGHTYDFSRFLSWARYGDTRQWRRFDAYTPTHLSGAFYESLLGSRGYSLRHVNYADRLIVQETAEHFSPRVVCFSTSFMVEVPTILDGLQRVRRAFPDAVLVVGGFMMEELLKDVGEVAFRRFLGAWGADACVVSAMGEYALLGLLEHLQTHDDLEGLELPATWIRSAAGYEAPPDAKEPVMEMNDSWVRWDELDTSQLYHTVHVRTARSCTFRCSFCSLFVIEGGQAFAQPQTLRNELERLARVGHVRSIVLTDDTFNVPHRRFRELLDVLEDFDFEWYAFYRSQFADEETGRMLLDSGCKGLFLGIESVNDQVLKNMNKATTLASYERGLEQLKKTRIPVHANFIVGFPGDRPEYAEQVVDFVDRWDLEFFSVSPWFCAPSTTITKERERFGIKGKYYNWSHDTMDSKTAIELEQWMIHQPRRAVYLSQLSSSQFWSEIMFYSNGYSAEELRTVVRAYNRFAGRDTPARAARVSTEVTRAQAVLGKREFPLPPDLRAGDDVLVPRPRLQTPAPATRPAQGRARTP